MSERVVVLGAGYAGASAVPVLEDELEDADLTWVSERDYHLVLHESHRVIRDPDVRDDITIPVEDIKSPGTEFVQGRVVNVDVEDHRVRLADAPDVEYDYLLIALGSRTAFYGIPGLREHAHTLKSLEDALDIHEAVAEAAAEATPEDPARILIGGAGLSGVQSAGEVAEYRDRHGAHLEITLVEALEEIMPGRDSAFQGRVRRKLEARDIEILTDDPITQADAHRVEFDERDPVEYDVLVWTGGVTGRDALEGADLENDHNRVRTDATFRTSDERVFAVGDAAVVDLEGTEVPPTAQAAWDAADVAAENVSRAIEGRALRRWSYRDKGTVMSIGEDAVAHDVMYLPVDTFDSLPARLFKKGIAARWIASITSPTKALSAWPSL